MSCKALVTAVMAEHKCYEPDTVGWTGRFACLPLTKFCLRTRASHLTYHHSCHPPMPPTLRDLFKTPITRLSRVVSDDTPSCQSSQSTETSIHIRSNQAQPLLLSRMVGNQVSRIITRESRSTPLYPGQRSKVLQVWTTVILSECMEPSPSSHGGQTARKDLLPVLLYYHSASSVISLETVKPLLCRIPFHCPRRPIIPQRRNDWRSKAWPALRASRMRRLARLLLIWKPKARGSVRRNRKRR